MGAKTFVNLDNEFMIPTGGLERDLQDIAERAQTSIKKLTKFILESTALSIAMIFYDKL
jgi:hypothetical protein